MIIEMEMVWAYVLTVALYAILEETKSKYEKELQHGMKHGWLLESDQCKMGIPRILVSLIMSCCGHIK